jgi:hypothetical protein
MHDAHRLLIPTLFLLANAVAFYLVRPGVPDLWAARARASAVAHGVGITYWFSWFGGTTPGNYSVITPWLCAQVGTEVTAGVAAVVVCALTTWLVRDTARPTVAAGVAAASVAVNLWCGRVPFLVGAAFAVAALVALRQQRKLPAALLTVLSVLASPVSGAFLALALSGLLLTKRLRAYRTITVLVVACAGATLITLAVLFGTPGPEPFPPYLVGEILLVLGLMLLAAPPDHLRTTLAAAAVAALLLFAIPNGMGANFARLALFCLPAAAVALSRRGSWILASLTAPILVLGALSSVSAVRSASRPASAVAYYTPLAAELDKLPAPANHRVELVNAAHAAYAALLDHAMLARGWETQQDGALNAVLERTTLDARSYRTWLDDNAVGYVALNIPSAATPEARVITAAHPSFLRRIWTSPHWQLYQVRHPVPIVATPAAVQAASQSTLTVHVPCACRVSIKIRWSKFLDVSAHLPGDTADPIEDSYRPAIVPDERGWTTLTTNRPGTYVLG